MKRDPALQPDAYRRDLVLVLGSLVGSLDPDADPVLAPLATDIEGGERPHNQLLQARDIGPHVRPAALEVEHDIGHALAGPVIGELAAAPGRKDRESGIEQV